MALTAATGITFVLPVGERMRTGRLDVSYARPSAGLDQTLEKDKSFHTFNGQVLTASSASRFCLSLISSGLHESYPLSSFVRANFDCS